MDGQRTDGPPTVLERAASAAVAGACGAAIAAGGSYTVLYALASQAFGTPSNDAGGTVGVLVFLLVGVGMSVGGGALLSKALGVSTWQRSILISAAAHAIGITLWIVALNHLSPLNSETYGDFGAGPLRSFIAAMIAAMYAFVVPLIVVFSSYRGEALGGVAVAIFLAVTTAALPVASVLVDSEELAVASGVVAWVMLPAITVLGSAITGPRSH